MHAMTASTVVLRVQILLFVYAGECTRVLLVQVMSKFVCSQFGSETLRMSVYACDSYSLDFCGLCEYD